MSELCDKCGEPLQSGFYESYQTNNPEYKKSDTDPEFVNINLCITCAQADLLGLNGVPASEGTYQYIHA